jgi:hypothetical protein
MKTSVLPALFAASVFAFPATASAQWAPSPTVIIVNPAPPAYGNFGAWRPGVAAAAWGGGCGAGWGGVVVPAGAVVAVPPVVVRVGVAAVGVGVAATCSSGRRGAGSALNELSRQA